ncbi:synaptophysin-like protein 2a isoform X3 [Syngnathoides biaculeatus]|uniref:synaptophysin-like protein 2a isoform X3 n=1 Tax=Syngnathoides biaculeatus TaxID=300417 RepID=UPI002ADE2F65|nr:synaptophysin-like protein 2a isoform X3 [Syngnathoides biaculeatus]
MLSRLLCWTCLPVNGMILKQLKRSRTLFHHHLLHLIFLSGHLSTLNDSLVFAIFAFAITGGYSGTTHIQVKCPDSAEIIVSPVFGYPFRLSAYPYAMPSCDGSHSNRTFLQGDFSSSAEFFVCVGVFGFLYCTATLILYLGYQHVYRQTTRGPFIDLVVTAAFAFLWLVSASAWGKGLTDVKWATNPEHLAKDCPFCQPGDFPALGRLNASVIFGFFNLILWSGNCWFICKETLFHKDPSPPATMEEGVAPGP